MEQSLQPCSSDRLHTDERSRKQTLGGKSARQERAATHVDIIRQTKQEQRGARAEKQQHSYKRSHVVSVDANTTC